MLFHILLIAAGLAGSLILFYRFPTLNADAGKISPSKVSVIIPARNEEVNLALLLGDLQTQNIAAYEIICVDDCSSDDTAQVARSFGAKLITVTQKPQDWTGKAWACQKGADAAKGELLLFLDADVRLHADALRCLMQTYEKNQCVISVQPYHQTRKGYEQFSFFFNMIQIAANATGTLFKLPNAGLYGPVIFIGREDYDAAGGHTCAASSIVDDLALGEKLAQEGIAYRLFLGARQISFRMYAGGIRDLLQGWIKNYATGALKTHPTVFLLVFLWISSCMSAALGLLDTALSANLPYLFLSLLFYVLWVLELFRVSRRIGGFKWYALVFYPVYLAMFLWVFAVSLIKKAFHLNVIWKGRKIKPEK